MVRRHDISVNYEQLLWGFLTLLLGTDLALGDDVVLAAWSSLAPLLGAFELARRAVGRLAAGAAVTCTASLLASGGGVAATTSRAALTLLLIGVSVMVTANRDRARAREQHIREHLRASRLEAERTTRFYETILDHSPDAVCVAHAHDGKMVWKTGGRSAARLLGYPRDWFDGRDVRDILQPGTHVRTAIAGDGPHERLVLPEFAELEDFETAVIDAGGRQRHLSIRVADLQDDPEIGGVINVVRDVTAQKILSRQLTAAEDQHRRLIEVMNDGVLRIGPDRTVTLANPKMLELLGRSADQVLWTRASGIGLGGAEVDDLLEFAASGHRRTMSHRITGPGGSRDVLLSAAGIDGPGGGPRSVIVTCTDISALRRAFDEVTAAREEAEAAVQAREQLLNHVSHELRTPLTPIMALAEQLTDGRLGSAEVQAAGMAIFDAAAHMRSITDDALALARAGAAHRLEITTVDVAAAARYAARLAGVAVNIDGNADAASDEDKLTQILVNLLANAAIHGAPPVQVSIRSCAGRAWVTVRDHGPGIDPEERELVFDPFVQGSRAASGSGLGLAIVKSLLDPLGGTVEIRDPADQGPGAAVTVTLPAHPSAWTGDAQVICLNETRRRPGTRPGPDHRRPEHQVRDQSPA